MEVALRESRLEAIYANARVLDEETVDDIDVISNESRELPGVECLTEVNTWLDNCLKECKLMSQALDEIEVRFDKAEKHKSKVCKVEIPLRTIRIRGILRSA